MRGIEAGFDSEGIDTVLSGRASGIIELQSSNKNLTKMCWSGKTVRAGKI